MRRSPRKSLSSKKQPKQQRSQQMVADILEAAIRVLAREGAQRFTTVRVAKLAGISVGSLYQYFPNKEALLFRIQTEEWTETRGKLEAMLTDARFPPLTRLRRAIRAFFRSERDEASYRGALDDAGVLIRDAPEARVHQAAALQLMRDFMAVAIPSVPARQRAFTAALVGASLESLGEQISRHPLSDVALDRWARAAADMQCGYLARLERAARKRREPRASPAQGVHRSSLYPAKGTAKFHRHQALPRN